MSRRRAIRRPRIAALAALAALTAACSLGPATQPIPDADPTRTDARLWRISPPAADAATEPSYLFGTMHTGHPDVMRVPSMVHRALAGSRTFCMEVLPEPEGMARMMAHMRFGGETTLATVVGANLYGRLLTAASRRGVGAERLQKLRPWAVLLILNAPEAVTGPPLDLALYQAAARSGHRLCGLERAREQLAVFTDTPVTDQILLLETALDNDQLLPAQSEAARSAYVRGEITRLLALIDEGAPSDPAARAAYDRHVRRMLDDRNARMAARMQPELERGSAFIAVGAAHLPGAEGLLARLRDRGWRVEAVAR